MKTKKRQLLIGLANEFAMGQSYLIPFGEVRNVDKDGQAVIQRLNMANAMDLMQQFQSVKAAKGENFPGLPVYIGHPDHPAFKERDKDIRAYGWVNNVRVTDAGLVFDFDWPPAGEELLVNKHFKFLSPHFMGALANEKREGIPIVDIVGVKSLGMSNNPNWPGLATLVNEEIAGGAAGTEEGAEMKFLERLAKALGKDPATATEDEIAAAIEAMALDHKAMTDAVNECCPPESDARKKLGDKASGADVIKGMANASRKDTSLANEKLNALQVEVATGKTTAEQAKTQLALANEKAAAQVDSTLDVGIKYGHITVAERDTWKGKLTENFANSSQEMFARKTVKTEQPGDRTPSSLAGARHAEQMALVNEILPKVGGKWDKAWLAAKEKRPDLFVEMKG